MSEYQPITKAQLADAVRMVLDKSEVYRNALNHAISPVRNAFRVKYCRFDYEQAHDVLKLEFILLEVRLALLFRL